MAIMSPQGRIDHWSSSGYKNQKLNLFNSVDNYLNSLSFKPKRILDIGCGYAQTTIEFQKKYGSELWLMDGDVSQNTNKSLRQGKFGDTDSMMFYLSNDQLFDYWKEQSVDYVFVDAVNPVIDENIKFDMVCSWLSCGFHYPVDTYKDLILKHTDEKSIILMDLRASKDSMFQRNCIDIKGIAAWGKNKKSQTVHFTFK
jgi:SAM-dependent methyltransferase